MRAVELARPVASAAKLPDDAKRLPIEDVDALIGAVGYDQKLLLGIDAEPDVPYRAAAERLLGDHDLLHERSILAEDLDPIVGAIAHVDEAVV